METITDLEGNWNQIKGKMKRKFALLTDSDLLLVRGKHGEMIGRLQAKLGKKKEEVYKVIYEL